MINLSKEQTLSIIYFSEKRKALNKRFSFTTKIDSKCLGCLTPIYISFKETNIRCIFCDNCKSKANPQSVIQQQYMRVIKQKQIDIIESVYK